MENNAQLRLITFENDWQLDRQTISVGKAGLARARAILETKSSPEERLELVAA